ncbi:N-acetylmuramoyl-L-alanine amidase [Aerococcus viridans]|uniref:N-acetylmuramoyl-L-alanine amidase n=1 Tax=Aerococcus viridans TaxID=1377 RepID=UPI0021AED936|nr:N-acetylmuramoyl-L-alanine amidase [Aerococcus viridans]MCT1797434.1 N-acetylmuramoyl-L-alanine amidase [Aerococcus viridans]
MAIPKSAKFKYDIIQDYKVENGKAGRFSAGKPTWVVVHSSGNHNASLESEIAYMTRNQDRAFTQAWAGHDKIIEIANTDYPAWGAGRTANKYAVQIEVTEDKRLTKAQKLQAIDREAFWVAVQCAYYGIPLNKVYSHADISRMYPQDTDHTDPIAFFKSVGVSWSAFKEQVKKYYDVLVAGGDTTKITSLDKQKQTVVASKAPTNTNTGIVRKYAEKGVFYPNETIIVRDAPTTKANIVARYHKGEKVKYHTVHIGNGYVWLQYTRAKGGQGYIPIREYYGGSKYGPKWGIIK